MRTFTFIILILFSLSAAASQDQAARDQKKLIGRCSYDNLTSSDGIFRKGYVVANFYRADGKVLVAEGVSSADGSILDRTDQGVSWPTYEAVLAPRSTALNFSGYWIDNLARKLNPTAPVKSTFVYATRAMGAVIISPLIAGSFLQNHLGQPDGYPACVFWESPISQ